MLPTSEPLAARSIASSASRPSSVRAIKDGAVDFLTKPFRDADLITAGTAAFLQFTDEPRLVRGKNACANVVDTKAGGNRLRRPLIVAGRHNNPETKFMQRFQSIRRCFLDRISHTDHPGNRIIKNNKHHGFSFVAPCIGGFT